MIPFPPSLAFTVNRGQTDTAGTTKLDTVSNAAIAGTLDSVLVTHTTAWLRNSVAGTPRNSQKITNSIVLASLPPTAGTYYDTVTVTAPSATPTSITYIVTLTVLPGTGSNIPSYATPGFRTMIRQMKSREIAVTLYDPGMHTISVITTAGRVITSRQTNGAGIYTVNTPAGSPALYIVTVESWDGKNVAIKKIVDIMK
jgi:hypothetical protein